MNITKRTERIAQVQKRYALLLPYLNEQTKRLWAAAEALALGRSGNAIVAEATGMSRTTLTKAKQEVVQSPGEPQRQRQPGGGRKKRLLPTGTRENHLLMAYCPP